MARMNVLGRLAGEIALNITVDESVHGTDTYVRLVEVCKTLKKLGAGSIILGCAGLAAHRRKLEEELNLSVIDPTQASVSMALGTLLVK